MDTIEKASKFIQRFFPDRYPFRRSSGYAHRGTGCTTYAIKHIVEDFYNWMEGPFYISVEDCEKALRDNGIYIYDDGNSQHYTNIDKNWLLQLRTIFPRS